MVPKVNLLHPFLHGFPSLFLKLETHVWSLPFHTFNGFRPSQTSHLSIKFLIFSMFFRTRLPNQFWAVKSAGLCSKVRFWRHFGISEGLKICPWRDTLGPKGGSGGGGFPREPSRERPGSDSVPKSVQIAKTSPQKTKKSAQIDQTAPKNQIWDEFTGLLGAILPYLSGHMFLGYRKAYDLPGCILQVIPGTFYFMNGKKNKKN